MKRRDFLTSCLAASAVMQAGAAERAAGGNEGVRIAWIGGSPDTVLESLRTLQQDAVAQGVPQASGIQASVENLEKRRAHIAYAEFQAHGYPIGSGSVESGNKLVVEARLKGSGMHWARPHVNSMVALRNIACNDRWEEAWPAIERHRRQQDRLMRTQRWHQRRLKRQTVATVLPSGQPEAARPLPLEARTPAHTVPRKPRTLTGKAHRPLALPAPAH